jgi:glycosyltransferase involved in cell wall biosynthesis
MKSPAVLYITQEFSDVSAGGAGVVAYELCEALAKHKQAVVHVLAPGHTTARTQLRPGLVLHTVRTIHRPLLHVPSFHMQVRRHAPRIIRAENIAVIHSNNNAGISVLRRLPNIATIHHPVAAEAHAAGRLQRLINLPDVFMERRLLRRAQRVLAPSHLVRDLLVKMQPSAAAKISVLSNGIDADRFRPHDAAHIRRALGITDKQVLVFFPGGARAKRKGTLQFLTALTRLETRVPYHVVLSGTSREMGWNDELQRALDASGLRKRIHMVGEIAYAEMPDYFAAADFVVYPSLFEGFGLPVVESMASGKAVIATPTGEVPYLVDHNKTGLLVPIGDDVQLAFALNRLLHHRAERQRLGAAAQARITSSLSWQAIAKRTAQHYRALLSSEGSP